MLAFVWTGCLTIYIDLNDLSHILVVCLNWMPNNLHLNSIGLNASLLTTLLFELDALRQGIPACVSSITWSANHVTIKRFWVPACRLIKRIIALMQTPNKRSLSSPLQQPYSANSVNSADAFLDDLSSSFSNLSVKSKRPGISSEVEDQLIKDVLSNGGLHLVSARSICDARPIYGKPNSKQRKQIQNKLRRWKEDPASFYKLVSPPQQEIFSTPPTAIAPQQAPSVSITSPLVPTRLRMATPQQPAIGNNAIYSKYKCNLQLS